MRFFQNHEPRELSAAGFTKRKGLPPIIKFKLEQSLSHPDARPEERSYYYRRRQAAKSGVNERAAQERSARRLCGEDTAGVPFRRGRRARGPPGSGPPFCPSRARAAPAQDGAGRLTRGAAPPPSAPPRRLSPPAEAPPPAKGDTGRRGGAGATRRRWRGAWGRRGGRGGPDRATRSGSVYYPLAVVLLSAVAHCPVPPLLLPPLPLPPPEPDTTDPGDSAVRAGSDESAGPRARYGQDTPPGGTAPSRRPRPRPTATPPNGEATPPCLRAVTQGRAPALS